MKFIHCHSIKCIWKCRLRYDSHLDLNVLKNRCEVTPTQGQLVNPLKVRWYWSPWQQQMPWTQSTQSGKCPRISLMASWHWFRWSLNTLRPRQNGHHFTDDTFKRILLNENVRISIKISLKFVPKGPINNNPSLVQIMAWRQSGDKPLSEPMMVS